MSEPVLAWHIVGPGGRPNTTTPVRAAADAAREVGHTVTPLVAAPPEDGRPAPEPCTTCGGEPHPSGVPCVCGGVNTIHAEVQGLREAALEAHVKLGWYPHMRPRDGSPTYAELVEALRAGANTRYGEEALIAFVSRAHDLLARIPKEEG